MSALCVLGVARGLLVHWPRAEGRGIKRFKCYMCLFICLTVKAVHLELVTDLSTQAFLQAFQRFIARRGRTKNIYSDNGTNFKGANKELNELGEFLRTSESSISRQLGTELDIKWNFIPAYSLHQLLEKMLSRLFEPASTKTKMDIKV